MPVSSPLVGVYVKVPADCDVTYSYEVGGDVESLLGSLRERKPVLRGPRGPVPYVAMWSGEEVLTAPIVETAQGIAYADESSVDRDRDGLLWSRVSSHPGAGEPLYRQMHPLRQRRAMRRLLCQVCAAPADHTEHGTLWLIQDQRDQWPGWPEGAQNTHPPLCLRCARIAVKSCPWLKEGYVAVRAQSFVSGAWGGLYRTGEPRTLQFEDPRIRWLQADQLVRELVDCTYVDDIVSCGART